jgi:hypothetical protein
MSIYITSLSLSLLLLKNIPDLGHCHHHCWGELLNATSMVSTGAGGLVVYESDHYIKRDKKEGMG